ncbi:hypothetical protein EWB00_001154 [Schistosoma japonicum]|uniref:Protein TEX261 n=1 Tax=Schistosoma japonicum TaxID=6182 RepID=Q86FG3_SCHJA|nr:SJCHGC05758 protein [Schistosoma japonicum]TNN15625.1 hypothetical protein EWB00_001154 [Schistosoma japonicum]TNN15626.1 hypothetical protein EWB00_001154 [Schistosoma japonicum]TNN15627.1 hypothetical protein EWB00_001154 [Schistosoma japonicum]TNN15628.1 hypothetical protein EWB00_001154 [Schistosoma japonicum]
MVSVLWIFSYVALLFYIAVVLFCVAVGLFYITELVEEYIVTTGKIIRYTIYVEIILHLILLITDDVSIMLTLVGLICHCFYGSMLKTFPAFYYQSFSFLGSVFMLIIHHLVAFRVFSINQSPFSYLVAYFTFFLWAVPFLFIISLSANDFVLPQTVEFRFLRESDSLLQCQQKKHDVVSAYLNRKRKSLYSFLAYLREFSVPLRPK